MSTSRTCAAIECLIAVLCLILMWVPHMPQLFVYVLAFVAACWLVSARMHWISTTDESNNAQH